MKKIKIFISLLLLAVIAVNAIGCAANENVTDSSATTNAANGVTDTNKTNEVTATEGTNEVVTIYTTKEEVTTADLTEEITTAYIAEEVLTIKATNLMTDMLSKQVGKKPADDKFIASMADFSLDLFKKSIADKDNSLISPLSVILALAMTANGADNETLAQMERLLGRGISLGDLNEYLYDYVKNLPSGDKSKLNIANSIWFRDDENRLKVESDFLQTNADYYNASVYKSAFDAQTLGDINDWVKFHTDGMIDKIINEIDISTVIYLINAVVFDVEWRSQYFEWLTKKGDFTDINGEIQNIDFMSSDEYKYIDDGRATGFIKPYFGYKYSFVALLPNENMQINEYIQSLTGMGFINAIKNAENITVETYLPKFEYDYEIKMNDILKTLGMPDAFDDSKADFKKMATSSDGNIFISEVLHKTYILLNETGTKAAAVTEVGASVECVVIKEKTLRFDRPFVYAIIDNATNLPVFIGTVMTFDK